MPRLIVVLTFLPVFFLEGLAGSFFRPLAASYVLAILGVAGRGADRHAGLVADVAAGMSPLSSQDAPLVNAAEDGVPRHC